jgi:hypothetical protein
VRDVPLPQDHPDDRAWAKFVFDHVAPDGTLPRGKAEGYLRAFYRHRPSGPTLSGMYLHSFPESELAFLLGLYPSDDPTCTIDFATLMTALTEAQSTRTREPPARDAPTATLTVSSHLALAALFAQTALPSRPHPSSMARPQ